jgi:hypothetical protein
VACLFCHVLRRPVLVGFKLLLYFCIILPSGNNLYCGPFL